VKRTQRAAFVAALLLALAAVAGVAALAIHRALRDPFWGHVRAGQRYVYDMAFGVERTDAVVSLSTTEAIVETSFRRLDGKPTSAKSIARLDPREGPLFANVWTSQGRPVGHERTDVAGIAFECDIVDIYTSPRDKSPTSRVWVAKKYPFLVRVQQETTVLVELRDIREPDPPEPAKH
jgi:hypothetical protein